MDLINSKEVLNKELVLFDAKEIQEQLDNIQTLVHSFKGNPIDKDDIKLFKKPFVKIYKHLKETEVYKSYHCEQVAELKKNWLKKYEAFEKENIAFVFLTKILDLMFNKLEDGDNALNRASQMITSFCQLIPCVLWYLGEDVPEGEFYYNGKIKIYKNVKGSA